jgi:hypothetical protein
MDEPRALRPLVRTSISEHYIPSLSIAKQRGAIWLVCSYKRKRRIDNIQEGIVRYYIATLENNLAFPDGKTVFAQPLRVQTNEQTDGHILGAIETAAS